MNIASRQKWNMVKRNFQVDDLVLVKEEEMHRNDWRLGRIKEIIFSGDGLVRRAKVILGDSKLSVEGKRINKPSIIERPVQKLVLLLEGH